MNKYKWLIVVVMGFMLAACQRHEEGGAHPPHDEKTSAHEGGHEHGGTNAVTHYNEATELFVEFPSLVKNEEAAFAAHLTKTADFKAVAQGRLSVVLSGNGQPEERSEVEASETAGIFRPALKPQHPGKRRLVFHLNAPGLSATHDLGEVEVFESHQAADAAAAAKPAGAGGIKFTKEQQWRIDFANTPAVEREVRESVPVMATLRPPASGEAQITAPSAGLLRAAALGFPQVGMQVAAGQTLALLSPRLGGETDMATLGLAVERARIEADYASRERGRLESLLASEAIAAKRVGEARNKERVAHAELNAAEQRLATYQGGNGGIAMKSPIAGTVMTVNAMPGSAVTEGQMLIQVANLASLWVEARVPESAIARIGKPGGVFFKLDGAAQATVLEAGRNARLVAFGGMVDATNRTVPAIFEFKNPGGALRAGMNVQAHLYTGRIAKGVAIPASAVLEEGGASSVFLQKEGESFERRLVELGPRDGDWVAVKSGIAPGERVVSRGAYQVRLAAAQPAAMGHGHAH